MCKLVAKHNFDNVGTRPQWDGVNITGYVYDYMIKDHLGNVRMLLTDEKKVDIYPAATLEGATHNGGTAISKEDDYYAIDMGYVVSNPSGIPAYQNNNGNPPPIITRTAT